jgi:hypothetical protein
MVTLILTLVLAAVTIPMALSYLTSSPDALENMFTDPYVPPDITETFDGEIKENIRIENTGNVDAYIRAALVIQAKAENGDILAYSPVHGTDYTLSALGSTWFKQKDYYYFKHPVPPGGLTDVMFSKIEALNIPLKTLGGVHYYLNIDVASQSIQALPPGAVESAWPVTVGAGSVLEPVSP